MPIDYKPADNGFLSKITNESEALKTVDFAAWTFIGTAMLQALLIGFILPVLLVIPAMIATLAIVLKRKKSRVAAFSLLALVLLSVFAQLVQMFQTMEPRFGGLFVAAVLIWAAIRALQATSFLKSTAKQEKHERDPATPNP